MFDPKSRYYNLKVKTLNVVGADGEPHAIRYVERRFLSPALQGTTIIEHTVTQGERLDNITARYLGDPTQFWRVCDANEVMDPNDLIDEVGRRIRIALLAL